jgi:hypothetical protein
MLSYAKLSTEMRASSSFNGIATKKFFDGLSNGIVRSVKEVANVTIVFAGNAGSPGRGYIHGILSSSSPVLYSLLMTEFTSRRILGVAATFLASAIARTADDLRTDAEVIVSQVSGVANGTGTVTCGGISLSPSSSFGIISHEIIAQGIHDSNHQLTEASRRIVDAVANALSKYLLTLALTLPVAGGSPSTGTASTTLTGKYIV